VVARRRYARCEPAEQRERIHLDGDGAVGISAFERNAHEPIRPELDALRSERRAQDIAQERLASSNVERAGACGGVQREAVERGAQGLVEGERAGRERRQAA
jgi:hypothetical protein